MAAGFAGIEAAGRDVHREPSAVAFQTGHSTGVAGRIRHWCRRNPVAASLLAAVTLGSAVGLWHLSRLSESLVRSTALEGAAQQSEMLDVVNALYSSKVVERLQRHGVVVTHDYATRAGAIPLPATFTMIADAAKPADALGPAT